jgi:hypothetical protein
MTNAEKFAADQAAQVKADAAAAAYVPPYVPSVVEPVPVVFDPSVPFAVMSDDVFSLVDSNNDGHFDKVVVSRVDKVAQAAKAAHVAKYAPYHAGIAGTREAAYRAHSGQSVENVAAAQESAVAQFNADYAGEIPVPPAK